jgi:hypothetical protein
MFPTFAAALWFIAALTVYAADERAALRRRAAQVSHPMKPAVSRAASMAHQTKPFRARDLNDVRMQ